MLPVQLITIPTHTTLKTMLTYGLALYGSAFLIAVLFIGIVIALETFL